jgi:hypothetical protein
MANSLLGFGGLISGGNAGSTLDGKSKRFVTDKNGNNVGFYSDKFPMSLRWLLGDPGASTVVRLGGGRGVPGGGGGGGGGTTPPTQVPRWAFPDYTQDWAFTTPAPFYTAPPPPFKPSNYPSTSPGKK